MGLIARIGGRLGQEIRTLRYAGGTVGCPCCSRSFREFLPYGEPVRMNALCPRCHSLERHRLLWLFFERHPELTRAGSRILHIAPESCLAGLFRGLVYRRADLSASPGVEAMDVMNLPVADGSFDGVICNHVLEHVDDDRRALRELARVLVPGGWAILQHPVDDRRDLTFENPGITAPADRLRVFGQSDHVRIYGRDYYSRLEAAGFLVSRDRLAADLGPDVRLKYGLPEEDICFCRKLSLV